MSIMHGHKSRVLDMAFLAFEAVMHVYIFVYLIINKDALLVVGYTLFELIMFIKLLWSRKYEASHHRKTQQVFQVPEA